MTKLKNETKPLIRVRDLKMHLDTPGKGEPHVVDDVSFDIMLNEAVGLVGGSGYGKSTIESAMIRLLKATSGHVYLDETDVVTAKSRELAEIRKKMQIIFQGPYSSLNPRETIQAILADPYQIHRMASGAELKKMVRELAESVGLKPHVLGEFPRELDGGKHQFTGIARALALKPEFTVYDGPVSALDVSVQITIINLLIEMQKKIELSCFSVSHDLSVVRHISNRAAVIYLGQIVELAPTDGVFSNALHPYTIALLSAVLKVNFRDRAKRIILKGDVPNPINPKPGCRFASRCPMAQEFCKDETPELRGVSPGHCMVYHYWEEVQDLLDD